MASGSTSANGCVNDAQVLARPTYANRYTPESDAEFVRSTLNMAEKKKKQRKPRGPVVDSYSYRQVCLRSYLFTTKEEKESVSDKMMKWSGKVREKLANFPFAARWESDSSNTNKSNNNNNNKTKFCCIAIPSIFGFGCLLPYAASVDVVDRRR